MLAIVPTGGEKLVDNNKVAALPTADSITADITTTFNNLKLRRKHKFMIFKLASDESGNVEIEKLGEPKASHDEFLSSLPNSDCRFAIYDYDYKSTDGRPQSKLWFVSWLPDNSTPHNMMAYSAAKGVFRDRFTGVFDLMAKKIEDVEVALGLRAAEDEESSSDFEDD